MNVKNLPESVPSARISTFISTSLKISPLLKQVMVTLTFDSEPLNRLCPNDIAGTRERGIQ